MLNLSLTDMLTRLIAHPTVSSTSVKWDMSNRPVIDELADWFEELGFKTRILPLKHQPQKANLIAVLGEPSQSGGLVLSGHTDTVPYDDRRWDSDPFTLSERDGRFYGLGTADMKGFFALAIEAIRPMLQQGILGTSQKAPLIILATADEESSMDGARELVAGDLAGARHAIIGEPTGLKPIHAHKGIMMESVKIVGRSGHSSNPALGNNALEAMHEVIGELLGLRAKLQDKYRHSGFKVPTPTMNLGCIHGGDNPNRICGQCELHFDFRMIPGMELEFIKHQLSDSLSPIAERRQIDISLHSLMPGLPAFEQARDSELIKTVESLSSYPAETVGFATEAPFLQQLGLQTVVLGPGHIDQAHQPNEYLGTDQIAPTVALLQNLIRHYCC
ncbi:acetylornithine deacetylase [Spongiibacter sp. KMU-158]|uniref:Acetylornithine deacetylase n=1 Tax=Spongiibacter pelagi TaxID=2760804 RepID=A0A927C096_9GAMM|nr:acetylornithine deacetylase [Spongiibacter pelagi]MBD2857421.1 acetylornithine deacetylase [Spongiibacter pelagi]